MRRAFVSPEGPPEAAEHCPDYMGLKREVRPWSVVLGQLRFVIPLGFGMARHQLADEFSRVTGGRTPRTRWGMDAGGGSSGKMPGHTSLDRFPAHGKGEMSESTA